MRSSLAVALTVLLSGCPSSAPPPCSPATLDAARARASVLASDAFAPLKGFTLRSAELQRCKWGPDAAVLRVEVASSPAASKLGVEYVAALDVRLDDGTAAVLDQAAFRNFAERAASILAALPRVEEDPDVAWLLGQYGKAEGRLHDPGEPLPWCVAYTFPEKAAQGAGGVSAAGGGLTHCQGEAAGVTEYSVTRLADAQPSDAAGLAAAIAAAHPGCETSQVRFVRSSPRQTGGPWSASGSLAGAGCAPSFRASRPAKGPWSVAPPSR